MVYLSASNSLDNLKWIGKETMIEIKKFSELTLDELHEILKLRSEIFIVEQKCAYKDIDGKDLNAIHIMEKQNGEIQGYLRVLHAGVSYDHASLGRIIVRKEARGKDLGRNIIQTGIDYIADNFPSSEITIGAQAHLMKFYNSLGFQGISEIYLEDGIPHVDMHYNKNA